MTPPPARRWARSPGWTPYPAHKVYTIRGAQREYLIPAVPEVFIKYVDMDANRMEVQVGKGWPPMN